MGKGAAAKKKPPQVEVTVPDKLYFRIGEVAEMLQLAAYVLRFWETEFPQLKPAKSSTGQRLYRQRDVEMAQRIKRLLYQEGYTIAGARQFMKDESSKARRQPMLFAGGAAKKSKTGDLKKIKLELESVRDLLKRR